MKVKKLLLSLLAICLLLPALALQASAATDSGEAGDNVKWTLDSEGTLTISGTGAITSSPWRNDYASVINKVVIEEGITSIYHGAFSNCTSIAEMTIPKSVTELKEGAFGCSIGSLYISDLKQWLEIDKFSYITFKKLYVNGEQITELVIPEGITEIHYDAFDDFETLESVYIPDSVTTIGEYAFVDCTSLREVRLPNGLTSIPRYAFDGCEVLRKITIPASVRVIGESAFGQHEWNTHPAWEPYGLQEIRFEGNAPLIADDAFRCIRATAYYSSENASWTSDKLRDYNDGYGTITWIADDSISDTGGSGDTVIVDSGTCGTAVNWTLDSSDTLTISGTGAITSVPWRNDYASVINKVVIEEGITSIYHGAFSNCTSIAEMTIPKSVTELKEGAFGCSIGSLYISDLKQWLEIDKFSSITFKKLYVNGEQITELVIPEGITEIHYGAFDDFETLESVYIPDSVTTIGEYAFEDCTSLREVRLPNGLTSIPRYAFDGCEVLRKITIPASVRVIGESAFGQHTWNTSPSWEPYGLQEIRFEGNAPLIADVAFRWIRATAYYSSENASWTSDKLRDYNDGRGSITWIADDSISDTGGSGDTVIVDSGNCGTAVKWALDSAGTLTISGTGAITSVPWQNDYASVINKVVIEEGITSIYHGAFSNCTSIAEMTVPKSVTELKEGAFGCSIGSLYISDLKQWLEIDKFSSITFKRLYVNGEQITELVIPEGITEIHYDAFDDFETLESVYIPDSVTSIGIGAFASCENLKEVRLPNGLTSIPSYAFDGCEVLRKITIPASVQVIGEAAFGQHEWNTDPAWEPYGLQEIRFEGNAPLIADDAFSCIRATAYYSSENASWTSDKLRDYNDGYGSITWVADDNIFDTGGSAGVYIIAEGYCGSNVYYVIYSNGEANIKPVANYALRSAVSYDMDDYASPEDAPWYPYRDQIKTITIEEGVTSIGDNAFAGCENLTEVIIQDGVAEVGASAFQNCEKLTEITFEGSAPTFGENAFAEVEATVNYPAGDSSWNQEVVEEMGGQIELKPDENLHAHSYEQVVTAPTCTEQGYTTYTCGCGKTYQDDFVDPVAHSYGAPAYVWGQDNSCAAEFICTVCGDKQSVACNVVSTPVEGGTLYVATVEFGGKSYFDSRTVADAGSISWGDVNGDGRVNFKDSVLMLQYASGRVSEEQMEASAADVNGDGRINFKDAVLVLQYASGRISEFPVDKK